jgi:hypothetical protein
LVSYPDAGSWSSAVSGKTTVTIPDPSSPEGFDYFGTGSASVSFGGVTFSTDGTLGDSSFFNVGPVFSGSPAVLSSQQQTFGLANILITFLKPTTGFSLYYGTFDGSSVTFRLSNGDSLSKPSVGGSYLASDFVGITDTPFTSVLITTPDSVLALNNLVYAVPELSTWAMMILGFFGIAFIVYRNQGKSALGAV